jgi:hypothetical protein
MPTSVEELVEIEAIKQLKARYFRFLDTKQWEAMRGLFTDDAYIEGARPYESVDDFIEARPFLDRATTTHHGHMPEIVFQTPTTARGIWAMFDRVEFPEPFAEVDFRGVDNRDRRVRGFTGTGHYEEEYRKEAGIWKISWLRLTRLRQVAIVEDAAPSMPFAVSSHGNDWLAPKP